LSEVQQPAAVRVTIQTDFNGTIHTENPFKTAGEKKKHTHTHTSNTFGEKKCENVLDWSIIIIANPKVSAVEQYSLPQFSTK